MRHARRAEAHPGNHAVNALVMPIYCCSVPIRSFMTIGLVFLAAVLSAPRLLWSAMPAAHADESPLSPEAAVSTALAGNPGLAEMQARAEAMAAIPSQAGSLADPMVSFTALNFPVDTFSRDQEPMTQLQFGIEQSLPFPGKLALKERAAELDADAASSNVKEARLRLIRNVKQTWWQIFYLDRALETVSRNQDLMRQSVEIARTKYSVGEGLQQEVLLAQVELSRLLDRRLQLEAMRREQAARLNALLDRAAAAPVQLPTQVKETLPQLKAEMTLYAHAEDASPLLERRRREVEAARTRRDFAERDRYPDFSLGAAYGFRQGENPDGSSRPDFASLRIAMSLPLYAGGKQDKAVDQRNSELLQKQYALQDEWNTVQAEISAALADYRRASEQVQLFRTGILPQARQTVASMLSGYQVDKVDFLNLVRSQVTLYDYETQYWKSFSEARQALARLAAAVGGEVTDE